MQYSGADATTGFDATYESDEYRYGYNGKEKDGELKGEGNSYDYGARIYDPRIGRWMSTDPKESKIPNWSTYVFCLDNPTLFVDPDGEYPVVTITKQKVGKALQRVIGYTETEKTQYTTVDLYKVTVTDTEDKNFKLTFTVTRDAFAVRDGDVEDGVMTLTNVAFEPKDGNINHFTAKPIEYPKGDGLKALKLTQYGSEVVHAEANEASVELKYRTESDVAAGIMIHVGGIFKKADGKTKCAASEGCFGVTNGQSSTQNPSNDYVNQVLGTIINQADKSKTNKGKIEVVIEKRNSSERPDTKKQKQQ